MKLTLTPELITVAVIAVIAGFILGLIYAALRRWFKEWRTRRAVDKMFKGCSISTLARKAEEGKVSIPYDFRRLITMVANSIDLDSGDDAAESNNLLAADLLSIGALKKGERF